MVMSLVSRVFRAFGAYNPDNTVEVDTNVAHKALAKARSAEGAVARLWVPPKIQVWTNTGIAVAALGFAIAAFSLSLIAVLGAR